MHKKFFIGIIIVTFIVSIFTILLSYLLSNKNIWNDSFPANVLNEHRRIAENVKSSKILMVSGSSSLFGVDTEKMSKVLNYPVINLSVHAGLGLDYILYDAEKNINNNDIVILPIEYPLYHEDRLSEPRVVQIWQNDKQYFDRMLFIDKIEFLYAIPIDLIKKLVGTYIGIPIKKEDKLAYVAINKNGDTIYNLETEENLIKIKEPFDKNKIYLDENTRQTIIDFLNSCKEKNVKVFVTYPPYYYKQKYFDGYNLEQINKINDFWQDQDVTILGQYTDFIYTDKNDFYDSQYHLNIKGREKRTEKLIELLKPYINNN